MFKRIILFLSLSACGASATTYHVFPSGTSLKKIASIARTTMNLSTIVAELEPGDTVYTRAGIHKYSKTIYFNKSGTAKAQIYVVAYPDETPIFDFTGNDGPGMVVDATSVSYVGQTFKGAGDNGLRITGSNIRIERCTFLENGDSGLQIEGSNNTIINCDSYYNRDATEQNADGFAPKLNVGSGNKFIGCRAWQNADDGWDGYLKSGRDVSQTLENCWAFKNGYRKDGSVGQGNGNGFKPGSNQGTQNWTMKNCLAYGNLQKGFDQNHNLGSITLYNCTSVNNGKNDYTEYEQPASGKSAIYKNCIQFNTSGAAGLNLGSFVQVTRCSWSDGFTVSAADFESVDPLSELTAARKPDGSLPDIKFMHLKEGSDLIDGGVDVGIAFKGKAPDLGCFESNYTTGMDDPVAQRIPGLEWRLYSVADNIRIEFTLPGIEHVNIALFELSGKRIMQSVSRQGSNGAFTHSLDMKVLRAGIYICALEYNGIVATRKIIRKFS